LLLKIKTFLGAQIKFQTSWLKFQNIIWRKNQISNGAVERPSPFFVAKIKFPVLQLKV
jgi:hypothetical protein